jgi:hypothetical protein
MAEYTRQSTITRTSTITRAGASVGYFTGFSRTGGFVRYRAGTPSTRQSSYARSYFNAQGEIASTSYTTTYVGDFIGNFIGNYSRDYAGNYVGDFIGNYIGDFIGNYSRDFIGYYSRSFAGEYTRNYVAAYARDFSRTRSSAYARNFIGNSVVEYTRTSTRSSTRQSTISGGSGETPTYTATASDAEYGLVVYGPDGVTEIINPGTRVINLSFYGTVSVGANSSATQTIEDAGDPSKVIVALDYFYNGITISTSGNTVTITNSAGYARNVGIIAIRI